MKHLVVLAIITISSLATLSVHAEDARFDNMGFFVTSVGVGNGGDLGGIKGADAHCQKLAKEAGAGSRTWRAYLSTEKEGGRGDHARHRIGAGPWYNAAGILIAANLTDLHLYNRTINRYTALDQNGELVNARGDSPSRHDILTGSQEDGMSFWPDDVDQTCNNWTSSDDNSTAMVGHHDRHGFGNVSWNATHLTLGCSAETLISTSGDGLFYCFAAD